MSEYNNREKEQLMFMAVRAYYHYDNAELEYCLEAVRNHPSKWSHRWWNRFLLDASTYLAGKE